VAAAVAKSATRAKNASETALMGSEDLPGCKESPEHARGHCGTEERCQLEQDQ